MEYSAGWAVVSGGLYKMQSTECCACVLLQSTSDEVLPRLSRSREAGQEADVVSLLHEACDGAVAQTAVSVTSN